MQITATLAADLAFLSETFATAGDDLVEGLRQLATDAELAVRSYLGLSVIASSATFPLTLTAMQDSAYPVDVVSSLMMPLYGDDFDDASSRLVVIFYAGTPGALVDLAADLSWLTGRRLADFALDQHLSLPTEPDTTDGVQAASVVNQAVGVLIGRGYIPRQAELEIDARAAAAGHSRCDAAEIILGSTRPSAVARSSSSGNSDTNA